jgi:hypothetical protein
MRRHVSVPLAEADFPLQIARHGSDQRGLACKCRIDGRPGAIDTRVREQSTWHPVRRSGDSYRAGIAPSRQTHLPANFCLCLLIGFDHHRLRTLPLAGFVVRWAQFLQLGVSGVQVFGRSGTRIFADDFIALHPVRRNRVEGWTARAMNKRRTEIACIGLRAKTGQAIVVVVAGTEQSLRAVARAEITVSTPSTPALFQPYHAVIVLKTLDEHHSLRLTWKASPVLAVCPAKATVWLIAFCRVASRSPREGAGFLRR